MYSFYRVDIEDRIVEIGGDWDYFSRSDETARTASNDLIGTPLVASISGDNPRMYILALLQRARFSKRPIEADYFCHAPDEMRHARMMLTGAKGGSVLVEHTFLSSHRRSRAGQGTIHHWRPKWVAPLKLCIDCDKVKSPDGWVPRETWPLMPKQNLFRGFCPDCSSKLNLGFSSKHRGFL